MVVQQLFRLIQRSGTLYLIVLRSEHGALVCGLEARRHVALRHRDVGQVGAHLRLHRVLCHAVRFAAAWLRWLRELLTSVLVVGFSAP
jgi:hypothetical protein